MPLTYRLTVTPGTMIVDRFHVFLVRRETAVTLDEVDVTRRVTFGKLIENLQPSLYLLAMITIHHAVINRE